MDNQATTVWVEGGKEGGGWRVEGYERHRESMHLGGRSSGRSVEVTGGTGHA